MTRVLIPEVSAQVLEISALSPGVYARLLDLKPYFSITMSTKPHPTILTERGMQIAERRIPAIAAKAGHDAYWNTLRHTGAVTVKTASGQVVERKLDGSVTVLMNLPVGKRVKPGTVLKRVR